MKLPNGDKAQITKYLLSLAHEDGRSKAQFFIHFGFSIEAWHELAIVLRKHAGQHPVKEIEDSPFGKRYIIEGDINTPNGHTPLIRVIWFIEDGIKIPRLVTAYPLRR